MSKFCVEEFQRFLLWAHDEVHKYFNRLKFDMACSNSRIVFSFINRFTFFSSNFRLQIWKSRHFWIIFLAIEYSCIQMKNKNTWWPPLWKSHCNDEENSSGWSRYGTRNDGRKNTTIQSTVEEKKKRKTECTCEFVYAEIVYPGEVFSRIRKKNNDNQIHAVDIKRPNECIWDGTHVSLCCSMVKFMNDHCKRTHTHSQDSVAAIV